MTMHHLAALALAVFAVAQAPASKPLVLAQDMRGTAAIYRTGGEPARHTTTHAPAHRTASAQAAVDSARLA